MTRRSTISRTPANKALPQHRGVVFLEGIPADTKSAFKAACARKQKTMRDVLIEFMRSYASGV